MGEIEMTLDQFLCIEDSDLFRQLSETKRNLLRSLLAHWRLRIPSDVYDSLTSNNDVPYEIKANKRDYTSFRTRKWRCRKIFREGEDGLHAVELILNSHDSDVANVYSAIFDKDPLAKYLTVRFPRSTEVEELDRTRLIKILKLLKPITRSYINSYITNEVKPSEFEALREILTKKTKDENYDIVISTLRGVSL